MILDRLLVRHRLNLLVAVPLAAVAVLTVPLLVGRINDATAASASSRAADVARQVSGLVQEVQSARLLSVAYLDAQLVSASDLDLQFAKVSDSRAQLLHDLDPGRDGTLIEAVSGTSLVARDAPRVLSRDATEQGVIATTSSLVASLIKALELDRQQTTDPAQAWTLAGLGSLLLTDESASESGALLLAAAGNPQVRDQARADALFVQGVEQQQMATFVRMAAPSEAEMFRVAITGESAQRLSEATVEVGLGGTGIAQGDIARHVFAALRSQTTLRQLVEVTIAQDVSSAARSASSSALAAAAGIGTVLLLLLVGVFGLSVLVGRSVSLPLRRLTAAAGIVADVAQEELADVADDDAGPAAVRLLPELPVGSRDELGDLALAFNRVRATTAQLLERQVAGRRNISAMFAGIGRRTSNLVGRQLALIDALESGEEDPQILQRLYRLDHVSTRLRRNASSLVVLSGDREAGEDSGPVRLPDAVRAALGTVEDFQRVALGQLPDVNLAPGAAGDVVLILAELLENAVLFSPPHTSVEVVAWVTGDSSYALTVADHGIGMPPQRLAEENARLRQRERLDLAPTDVLGLFVVGRVSRRHAIDVTLLETPGGGVTARIVLPQELFVAHAWSGSPDIQRMPAPAPRQAAPARPELAAAVDRAPRYAEASFAAPPAAARYPDKPVVAASHAVEFAALAGNNAGPVGADRTVPFPGSVDAPQVRPPAAPGDRPPGADDLRRRVPGSHWGGPPPPARADVTAEASAPPAAEGAAQFQTVERVPASRVAAILDGVGRAQQPGGNDPDATRRLLDDLEAALALAPRGTPTAPPPAPQPQGQHPPVPPAAPPPALSNGFGPGGAGGNGNGGSELPPLVRRVPGATMAALWDLDTTPVGRREERSAHLDADETLQAILDIDEAVQRAGEQTTGEGVGSSGTTGRWGDREEGGSR